MLPLASLLAAGLLAEGLLFQSPSEEETPGAEETILGKPADWALDRDDHGRRLLDVAAGTDLLEEARVDAAVVGVAPGGALEVWETRPGWARVIHADTIGWIRMGDLPLSPWEDSPWNDSTERAADSPRSGPDPVGSTPTLRLTSPRRDALLATVHAVTGSTSPHRRFASFDVYSTLDDDDRLLDELGRIVQSFPDAYGQLLGLPTTPESEGIVVVVAREDEYRRLHSILEHSQAEPEHGFELAGIAVLSTEGRARSEVVRTLVHELTHILNGTVLRTRTPRGSSPPGLVGPWLEEGLATDLGLSHVDARGVVHTDSVEIEIERTGRSVRLFGPGAALLGFADNLGRDRLPTLEELVAMDRWQFRNGGFERLHLYIQSATFVRFLRSRADLREPFHAFLREVSAGTVDSREIFRHLPIPPERIERFWSRYVHALAATVRERRDNYLRR